MDVLPVIIVVVAMAMIAIPVVLYARYLMRRRVYWFGALTQKIPEHSDWWKAQRDKPGELLYVAIGDSAAQGIGASLPRRSYVGLIARHLRERTGRTVRVVNLGISGATVRIAIEKELPRLAKLEPHLVTVSIGANDIASFDAETFERDIRELYAALPAGSIVADLPTFYFLPAEKLVRLGNGIVRRVAAERGFTVVPLHARMKRQGLWGVSNQFAGDLFHPNDRGYRVWASAFLPEIDKRFVVGGAREGA
ncbi:MAG: SGNH/GDSL hydrolase family protein [Microbacteriaceae bacterium]